MKFLWFELGKPKSILIDLENLWKHINNFITWLEHSGEEFLKVYCSERHDNKKFQPHVVVQHANSMLEIVNKMRNDTRGVLNDSIKQAIKEVKELEALYAKLNTEYDILFIDFFKDIDDNKYSNFKKETQFIEHWQIGYKHIVQGEMDRLHEIEGKFRELYADFT